MIRVDLKGQAPLIDMMDCIKLIVSRQEMGITKHLDSVGFHHKIQKTTMKQIYWDYQNYVPQLLPSIQGKEGLLGNYNHS